VVFYGSQLGDPQPLNILRTMGWREDSGFFGVTLNAETSDRRRQVCGVLYLMNVGFVNLLQTAFVGEYLR
jgi:hypothetical protein